MANNPEPPTDEFGNPIHPVSEVARDEKEAYIIHRGVGRLLFAGVMVAAACLAFPAVIIPLVILGVLVLVAENL